MSLEIQFLGGAGTVTGSKYLVTYNGRKILVDCGLFQGVKSLRIKNWEELEVNPRDIEAVVLTHAHIDHSGYLPRLIKSGFAGRVYSTEATYDLCKILLPDSGHLMEEEADYLNRKKRSKHSPALPLFTQEDAERSLLSFSTLGFEERVDLGEGLSFEFHYSGHILGASSVVLHCGSTRLGFSGDVGRLHDEILYPPKPLPPVDYLVLESTYGNRKHKDMDIGQELRQLIHEACKQNGVVIIPAFAVGRAQSLTYFLWKLRKEGQIPDVPMYLNSPMATNVNSLLAKHSDLHRLSPQECEEMCGSVQYVRTVDESRALNERSGPMVIISASGMLTGGRVLHHIKAFGGFPQNTILLSGFQPAGTRGEALEKGADEIKIHGEYVKIRAQVRTLENTSAHADYVEIIDWLKSSALAPKRVFITHGEASASDELRRRLGETFHWSCRVPEPGERIVLE